MGGILRSNIFKIVEEVQDWEVRLLDQASRWYLDDLRRRQKVAIAMAESGMDPAMIEDALGLPTAIFVLADLSKPPDGMNPERAYWWREDCLKAERDRISRYFDAFLTGYRKGFLSRIRDHHNPDGTCKSPESWARLMEKFRK